MGWTRDLSTGIGQGFQWGAANRNFKYQQEQDRLDQEYRNAQLGLSMNRDKREADESATRLENDRLILSENKRKTAEKDTTRGLAESARQLGASYSTDPGGRNYSDDGPVQVEDFTQKFDDAISKYDELMSMSSVNPERKELGEAAQFIKQRAIREMLDRSGVVRGSTDWVAQAAELMNAFSPMNAAEAAAIKSDYEALSTMELDRLENAVEKKDWKTANHLWNSSDAFGRGTIDDGGDGEMDFYGEKVPTPMVRYTDEAGNEQLIPFLQLKLQRKSLEQKETLLKTIEDRRSSQATREKAQADTDKTRLGMDPDYEGFQSRMKALEERAKLETTPEAQKLIDAEREKLVIQERMRRNPRQALDQGGAGSRKASEWVDQVVRSGLLDKNRAILEAAKRVNEGMLEDDLSSVQAVHAREPQPEDYSMGDARYWQAKRDGATSQEERLRRLRESGEINNHR
jgi:hypothetical protein